MALWLRTYQYKHMEKQSPHEISLRTTRYPVLWRSQAHVRPFALCLLDQLIFHLYQPVECKSSFPRVLLLAFLTTGEKGKMDARRRLRLHGADIPCAHVPHRILVHAYICKLGAATWKKSVLSSTQHILGRGIHVHKYRYGRRHPFDPHFHHPRHKTWKN